MLSFETFKSGGAAARRSSGSTALAPTDGGLLLLSLLDERVDLVFVPIEGRFRFNGSNIRKVELNIGVFEVNEGVVAVSF